MTADEAIRQIIARSDLADLHGRHILVTEVTSELLDYLSAHGAAAEDLEPECIEDEEGAA